jgi:amino acid transporter
MAIVLLLGVVAIVGIRESARVTNLLVAVKVVICGFVICGFVIVVGAFNRGSAAAQRLPRLSCSRSMASKRALKLPLPKPREPWRSMSSKNTVGRSPSGLVKIWSR